MLRLKKHFISLRCAHNRESPHSFRNSAVFVRQDHQTHLRKIDEKGNTTYQFVIYWPNYFPIG